MLTPDQPLYRWLDGIYTGLLNAPDGPAPQLKVGIISTPRSGSKLFCSNLSSTGRMGLPNEWLSIQYMEVFFRKTGWSASSLSKYVDFMIAKTTSSNGVFVVNFHVNNLWDVRAQYSFDILEEIQFDRLYYLSRQDLVAQSLSFAKAKLTNKWTSFMKPALDLAVDAIPDSAIAGAMREICLQREYYAANFAGKVRREYNYEDFSTTDSCYIDVLRDCGIENPEAVKFDNRLQKQSSAEDVARANRFRDTLKI
jgi:LPS sulfotransferase NodH